jgi:hypothetical protein
MTLDNKRLKDSKPARKARVNRLKNEVKVLRDIVANPLDTKIERAERL